ncbi:MAG: hypothetical protein WAL29_10985 [Bacteroidales bacterium]
MKNSLKFAFSGIILLFFYLNLTGQNTLPVITNIYSKHEVRSFNPASDAIMTGGKRIKEAYKPSVSDDHKILFFGVKRPDL